MICIIERVRISILKDTADIMFLLFVVFCQVFFAFFLVDLFSISTNSVSRSLAE